MKNPGRAECSRLHSRRLEALQRPLPGWDYRYPARVGFYGFLVVERYDCRVLYSQFFHGLGQGEHFAFPGFALFKAGADLDEPLSYPFVCISKNKINLSS